MDKYELIDSIVVGLNALTVQGVGNMRIVLDSIQKLVTLRDGLKDEDAAVKSAEKKDGDVNG